MSALFQDRFSGKLLNFILKGILLIGLIGLLCYELKSTENPERLWAVFLLKIRSSHFFWFLATLLLMPLNWIIETQKWYPLLRRFEGISFRGALKAVLAGAALSIFSPNRLGEYGGRLLFIDPCNQRKALMIHVAGGIAQFLILGIFGALGAIWCSQYMWQMNATILWFCMISALAGSVFLLLIYFNFRSLLSLCRRITWLNPIKRYVKDFSTLEHFSRQELGSILYWSALRYAVSCTQYFFLLQFFEIETGIIQGLACISTLFFIQTCLPLPPVAGFFARGNVAIWVWSTFSANEFSCLGVTYLLWIINLFLPALFGTFSILHVNISKSLGYENE